MQKILIYLAVFLLLYQAYLESGIFTAITLYIALEKIGNLMSSIKDIQIILMKIWEDGVRK